MNLRNTSPLYNAVILVAENGRMYYQDLLLLLNSRNSRARVLEAIKPNDYTFHGRNYSCTVFDVHGKGYQRILSLNSSAAFLVNAIAADYYGTEAGSLFYENYRDSLRASGTDKESREIAASHSRCIAAAKLMGAGMKKSITDPARPMEYIPAKQLKSAPQEKHDKRFRFSQMRGVFVNKYQAPYPMFSCSGLNGISFHGFGEEKMLKEVRVAFPAYPYEIDTCIITGDRYRAALDTLRTRKRYKCKDLSEERYERFNADRVTEVYEHIIFATMDEEGINVLRLFSYDPAGRAVARLLVPDADLYYTAASLFEYDAKKDDQYYIQFLTGDIARMRRIAAQDREEKIAIYCFPGQAEFLKDLFAACDNKPEIIPLTQIKDLMGALSGSIEHYQRKKDC